MAKKIRSGMISNLPSDSKKSSLKKSGKQRQRFSYCKVCNFPYLASECPKCKDLKLHNERVEIMKKYDNRKAKQK